MNYIKRLQNTNLKEKLKVSIDDIEKYG